MSAQSGSRVYLFDSKASSKLVLAAIVAAVTYAGYIALANWNGIAV